MRWDGNNENERLKKRSGQIALLRGNALIPDKITPMGNHHYKIKTGAITNHDRRHYETVPNGYCDPLETAATKPKIAVSLHFRSQTTECQFGAILSPRVCIFLWHVSASAGNTHLRPCFVPYCLLGTSKEQLLPCPAHLFNFV